jgi:hypothetical protein
LVGYSNVSFTLTSGNPEEGIMDSQYKDFCLQFKVISTSAVAAALAPAETYNSTDWRGLYFPVLQTATGKPDLSCFRSWSQIGSASAGESGNVGPSPVLW